MKQRRLDCNPFVNCPARGASSLVLLGFGNGNRRVACPKTAFKLALVEPDQHRGFAVAERFACLPDDGRHAIPVRFAAGFQASGVIRGHPVLVNRLLGFTVAGLALAVAVRLLGLHNSALADGVGKCAAGFIVAALVQDLRFEAGRH